MGLAISVAARASEHVGHIALESTLPNDQVSLLQHDREIFATIRVPESNTALKQLLGTSSNSSAELNAWLEARVQAVVGVNFNLHDNTVGVSSVYQYPNPGVFPVVETSTVKPSKGVVIMSNVGISAYQMGKSQNALLGLNIEGVGIIRMTSPRAGVIQVGPGLFNPPHPIDKQDPLAAANSISRLATFFHESRHSDGNGLSLGFIHAVCPEGHHMQGRYACDRNLNGPYTVGAQMLKALTESCAQCTAAQREALRLEYADSFGRVLPTMLDGKTPTYSWNATPEGSR